MSKKLDIADDVWIKIQNFARRQKRTMDDIVNNFVRDVLPSLNGGLAKVSSAKLMQQAELSKVKLAEEVRVQKLRALGVFPYHPKNGKTVTSAMVKSVIEHEGW